MIVVFGSINLDLVATVALLPNAGETLIARSLSMSPGGKGANQALAARRAGSSVAMYGAIGRDAFSDAALALLREDGVDLSGVRVVDGATGIALIHVDADGENAITVAAGANASAVANCVPDDKLDASTTLVMQLEVPIAEVRSLACRAHAAGSRVILNAAPAQSLSPSLLDCVDVLIVNETEARTAPSSLGFPSNPEAFVKAYRSHFGRDAIVSLGAQGVVASSASATIRLPAPKTTIVDTIGAGDALVGALASALDRNVPWRRALAEGVAAGTLACTKAGAQPSMPQQREIAALADFI